MLSIRLFILLLVCYPACCVKSKAEDSITLSDDSLFTWTTSNPYKESDSLVVQVEDGYLLAINVLECDIAGEDGDYLLIKTGKTLEGGTGRTFTYNLNSPRKYLVYGKAAFFKFDVKGQNEKGHSGATVTFQRYGEQQTTTTEKSLTTNNFPLPAENETTYISVNVFGPVYSDYFLDNTVVNFKKALVEMATEYCAIQNFYLLENITIANVQINLIKQCQFFWPNAEHCVQVTFAIPVVIDEENSSWTGYQLTPDHLLNMWTTLGKKYLYIYGFGIYEEPDHNYAVLLWSAAIASILLVFLGILLFVRFCSKNSTNKSSVSDTASIVSRKRVSDLSLSPHPLQSTPQLFENDYPMYEPGFLPSYGTDYAENPAFEDDESEDEIPIPIHFTKFNGIDHAPRESET